MLIVRQLFCLSSHIRQQNNSHSVGLNIVIDHHHFVISRVISVTYSLLIHSTSSPLLKHSLSRFSYQLTHTHTDDTAGSD